MKVSVIICTYKPRKDHLERTLKGLRDQSVGKDAWELVIVDNSPGRGLEDVVDLSWHCSAKITHEKNLGLAHARIRGMKESTGDILIFVDQDNILAPDYLETSIKLINANQELGAIGGRILPEYEIDPPEWFCRAGVSLACRDLGDTIKIGFWSDANNREYPIFSPVGAGMVLQSKSIVPYIEKYKKDFNSFFTGRAGSSLASGEDNDLIMNLLEHGWGVGYFPQLKLTHLIPAERLEVSYLARLNHASSKTWIQVLENHGVNPWAPVPSWSVVLRQVKAFFVYRAWSGPAAYIRWRGACGKYEGLALK